MFPLFTPNTPWAEKAQQIVAGNDLLEHGYINFTDEYKDESKKHHDFS